VELEKPAHVAALVTVARHPFMVAAASLVGVDTYLGPPEPRRPVDIGRSVVGTGDFLLGVPSLDPRLGAGTAAPVLGRGARPVAVVRGPAFVEAGDTFPLDGSESRAMAGRRIARYSWQRLS
jgi:hypothetical protein